MWTKNTDVGNSFHSRLKPGSFQIGKRKVDAYLFQPPGRRFCNLSLDPADKKRLLVDPRFSHNQVFLFPLRLEFHEITLLAIQDGCPGVAEFVIFASDRSSRLTPVRRYFYVVIEETPHDLLTSLAARCFLNLVVLARRRPEIHFRRHLGVGTRTVCAKQAIFANQLIGKLWTKFRLRSFHPLND